MLSNKRLRYECVSVVRAKTRLGLWLVNEHAVYGPIGRSARRQSTLM